MLTKEEILDKHWPCDTYIGRTVVKGKVIENTFHEDKCRRCENEENVYAAMDEYASQDKWVSVKDELPEKGKPVLIFNGHWIGVGYYKKNFALNIEGEPDWCDEATEYIEPSATHWQPLPQKPNR